MDLIKTFPDEQSCIEHLEQLRWGKNVVSPFDKSSKVYKCSGNKYKCKNTGYYFNVKTNTLFDATKIKLQKWFMAIYLVTSHKKGISSVQLSKDIDVTQKTAWFMLQRIRNCFCIENNGELDGEIEADETFVGGKNKNRHKDKKVHNSQGRSFKDKTPVLGFLRRENNMHIERAHKVIKDKKVLEKIIIGPSKIIAKIVPDTKSSSLHPLIINHVKKDSLFLSDEWYGYAGCDKRYNHQFVDHGKKQYVDPDNPNIHTNTIEGAWKILKNSVRDMYNHVSRKHLQKYIDEFVFRYNLKEFSIADKMNLLFANTEYRLTYKMLIND